MWSDGHSEAKGNISATSLLTCLKCNNKYVNIKTVVHLKMDVQPTPERQYISETITTFNIIFTEPYS